jgi:hypothetical protein
MRKLPKTAASEVREIAIRAYFYLFPLVLMDITRRQVTNIEAGKMPGHGPMNSFSHIRAFPDADFRAVVRPNFDTLYSSGWLDLTREPMIVSAPDTDGRYYMLPMLDMWSDVFAVPGKRTTGTAAAHFAVVPSGWKGNLPRGVEKIQSPTPHVWIIGRTQTNGPADYQAVHKVQDGYAISPLSRWRKPTRPVKLKVDPAVNMKTPPLDQIIGMKAKDYFTYGLELMRVNQPHITDQAIVAQMSQIGLEAKRGFEFGNLAPAVKTVLQKTPADGLEAMKAKMPTLARIVNGWQMNTDTMGVYGNYYLKRAIVAMAGLGANQPEDAVYPLNVADSDGHPLGGDNNYVLHFEKDHLPPAEAFWSVTMYDKEGFQVANEINRFAIGDRDNLTFNSDGSLDLYIQNGNPGPARETNWLPSPKGALGVTMRIYGPKLSVLDGTWAPPPFRRLN